MIGHVAMPIQIIDYIESGLYNVPVKYRDDIRLLVARAYTDGHLAGLIYGQRIAHGDAEARKRLATDADQDEE